MTTISQRTFLILLFITILLLINGCKGTKGDQGLTGPKGDSGIQGPPGSNGNSDKEIRFYISSNIGISSTQGWLYSNPSFGIIKFNINNYVDVDSVVMVSFLQTSDSSANCIFELYNLTDSTFISESQIVCNSFQGRWMQSQNIYHYLPLKEITLVPFIKSGKDGVQVTSISAYLFLYRK